MTKAQTVLLLGGPADGKKYAIEPGLRTFAAVVGPTTSGESGFIAHYSIGTLLGIHHFPYNVGVRDMNACPITMLLAGYRRPNNGRQDTDRLHATQAENPHIVTVLGGSGDGQRVVASRGTQAIRVGRDDDHYRIVPLVGKDGMTYRVAIRDPLNECPIKMLTEGYRQGRTEELENCRFCGARVESPCEAPPPGTCEKALNAAYGKRNGGMR
jgi:hypothetical protein